MYRVKVCPVISDIFIKPPEQLEELKIEDYPKDTSVKRLNQEYFDSIPSY